MTDFPVSLRGAGF